MENVKILAKMDVEKMQTAKSSDIELYVLVKKILLEILTRDVPMTMSKMTKIRKMMDKMMAVTMITAKSDVVKITIAKEIKNVSLGNVKKMEVMMEAKTMMT